MRRLQRFSVRSERNTLRYWHWIKNPFRVALNFLVIYIARYLPSFSLKNFLYRLIGVKVGKNASIALGATIDIFFPELIEVGENAIIGYNTVLLGHEFLTHEWRKGRVVIGKNVVIGANCTILPGIEIGDNTVVSAMSLVNKDVPPDSFVGGVPIRKIEKNNFYREE